MTRSSSLDVSSNQQRFSMFDFNEDDERVETASKKLLGKYVVVNPNHKRKRPALLSPPTDNKYTFLQYFSKSEKDKRVESSSEPILVDDEATDVAAERGIKDQCEEIAGELVDADANSAYDSRKVAVSSPVGVMQEDGAVNERCNLDVPVLSSSSNCENDPEGIVSDDESEMDSSSASICTLEENEVLSTDSEPECCSLGHKIDNLNNKVVVFPDFILYGDIYCTESHLTFSSNTIRVEGSAVNGSKGTFNAEWALSDIINIESEWCGRVETAMINLHFKPNASKGVGQANETSGIVKLKFSVYDPHWSEGQEAIKSLDVRYRDMWNVTFDGDREKDDKVFMEFTSMALPKPCLHVLDETFEDVIYPQGDPDAVSISKRDVELLWPETFINDTIIDFYIKYLQNKIQSEDKHRFHFFNSFFFRKLADLDKDPSSIREGRAAFQRVRKWTKNVNLFEKDYIFIPVNYSRHWSLIIICHPGEVAHFRDEEHECALRVPCILHMDSIRGSHRGLKNLIQSYLYEEWKERHSEGLDDASSKFSCLRFVPLELPQQENSFDCGLFLLHYVELFLEEAPMNFNPFKITEFSNYLNRNWFLPQEASLKRASIKKLIYEILQDRSQKVPHVESITKNPCSEFFDTNENETGIELLEGTCSSVKICQGDSSLNTELGNGISLLLASSLRVDQKQIKEPGLGFREDFEPGTSTRPFSCRSYSRMEVCHINYMSPIEEAEESVEEISDSSSDPEYHCQIAGLPTECPTSYVHEGFRSLDTSWEQNGLQGEELYEDDESSSGTSSSESQKSSEIGVDDDRLHHEFEGFGHPKESDGQEEFSTSSEDLETRVVADSQEADCTDKENDPTPNDVEFGSIDKIVRNDNMPTSNENLTSDLDEPAAKRPKFVSPED